MCTLIFLKMYLYSSSFVISVVFFDINKGNFRNILPIFCCIVVKSKEKANIHSLWEKSNLEFVSAYFRKLRKISFRIRFFKVYLLILSWNIRSKIYITIIKETFPIIEGTFTKILCDLIVNHNLSLITF